MYKLKLGRSLSFDNDQFYGELEKLSQLKYDSLDFDLCAHWTDEAKENELYKHLEKGLDAIRGSGLFFNGVHLSFGPRWDYSLPDEKKRNEILHRTKELIERIDVYHPNCYIFHGSFEPISDEERGIRISALKESLNKLVSMTSTALCIENLPRTCLLNTVDEAVHVVDAVKGIKICLDSNHFLTEKSEDAVTKLGERIYTLHISDHDYINERHWMPKNGQIDWKKFLLALKNTGYNGIFNYEISTASSSDIKENYNRLLEEFNEYLLMGGV